MKIKHTGKFERNGVRVFQRYVQVDSVDDDAYSRFRHVDLVKFLELVASMRFDYE